MNDKAPSGPPDPVRLQNPLARLLRPLVRLLIRSGMTYPALCDLLRELYVNVAEHEFALPGKEQTDSRVSLLTGIHRKEVGRLRGTGAILSQTPVALSRRAASSRRWLGGPPFSDALGNALPLPRTAPAGPSFESLVVSVTRDVRPRAVLDEWMDRALVSVASDGTVTLTQTAYLPQAGGDQQLYYFGRNLHDHIAAASANVLATEPMFFERAIHYDGLSAATARHMEAKSRELASAALQSANVEAVRVCDSDGGGPWRWNFGIYIYAEEGSAAPAPDLPSKVTRTKA